VWLVARDREQEVGHREQGLGNRAEELRASEGESGGVGDGHGESYAQSMRRWFLPVKNNLASDAAAMGRAFELVEGRVLWRLDETPPTLAEVLLPSVHHNDRRRQRNAAAEWLKEALADGPVASGELYRQAIECGFSKGTMQRAATELGVKSHKTGFNAGWELRWTPTSVPRGRGAMLKAEGPAFRIFGSEGPQSKAAVAAPNSPQLSEVAQLESVVEERNSPPFCEGAQLEEEQSSSLPTGPVVVNSSHFSEGAQVAACISRQGYNICQTSSS
jgi:hypothetical protein